MRKDINIIYSVISKIWVRRYFRTFFVLEVWDVEFMEGVKIFREKSRVVGDVGKERQIENKLKGEKK